MRWALLLVALVGCASGPEYRRGVMTPARPAPPAHTPAGAGIPGERVPGRGMALPPSHQPRAAKSVKDWERPGIYAAAGSKSKEAVLAELAARPRDSAPPGMPDSLWAKCWHDVSMDLLMRPGVLTQLDSVKLECLRQRLLADCGGWFLGRADEAKEKPSPEGDLFLRRYLPGRLWNQNAFDDAMLAGRVKQACKTDPGRDRWGPVWDATSALNAELTTVGREELDWRDMPRSLRMPH